MGSLRDREVACSASDRQGSSFESCVWRRVSSQSFHHPQEVLLAQFSLYVHKGGLKPDSFHFISYTVDLVIFARFLFSRISRRGQIHDFKKLAKIIIIRVLLRKNVNSRTLNLVKRPKIKIRENLNTRK